jgi:hypothetical protein
MRRVILARIFDKTIMARKNVTILYTGVGSHDTANHRSARYGRAKPSTVRKIRDHMASGRVGKLFPAVVLELRIRSRRERLQW